MAKSFDFNFWIDYACPSMVISFAAVIVKKAFVLILVLLGILFCFTFNYSLALFLKITIFLIFVVVALNFLTLVLNCKA